MKLHQVIALIQSAKKKAEKGKTDVYHLIQKTALFQGLQRTYQPRNDGDYVYPPESSKLTYKAADAIATFIEACSEHYDLCASQDWGNTETEADVVVDGVTIIEGAPVSYLLFLEKQLEDVKTFISKLPELAIDKDWEYDENRGCFVTLPKETVKTKKITEFVKVFEPTEHHPGQSKEVSKDVVEGTWSLIEFSGGLPADTIKALLGRVAKLQKAVIKAREEANAIEVAQMEVADSVFNYIFGDYNNSRAQV